MPFKKILVPLDASELAQKCLKIALSLAGAFNANVVLLGIRPRGASLKEFRTRADLDSFEDEASGLMTMARKYLRETKVVEHQVKAEVRAGSVEGAIIEAARDHMVDLIVIGTHGKTGLRSWITGTPVQRVQGQTSASVLVVKMVGYPYLTE
jgi:nucleotide-binding universal stress UspA family protein